MTLNIQHPGFVKFLETLIENIISQINLEQYYKLTQERKLSIIHSVYIIINKTLLERTKLTDDNTKVFIQNLLNKTITQENYELSGVLKDIINNFDSISETTKPQVKKSKRNIKIVTNE